MSRTREDKLVHGALAVLLALSAALVLAYDFLPLQDWGEQLAMGAITRRFNDTRWEIATYYDHPKWFFPYHVFRWTQAALAYPFGHFGLKLALLIPIWGAPLLAYVLARQTGRDHIVALAAFCVCVEANFLWGFIPYQTGVVIFLGTTCLMVEWLKRRSPWLLLAVGLGAIVTFFAHPLPTLLLFVTCGVLAIYSLARRTLSLIELLAVAGALLPAALLLAFFLAGGSSGGVGPSAIPVPTWAGLKASFIYAGLHSGLTLLGSFPVYCFAVAVVALIAGAVFERGSGGSSSGSSWTAVPIVLLCTWTALAILLPGWWNGESVGDRVVSLAALGIPLAIPFSGAQPRTRLAVGGVVFAGAMGSLVWAHRFFHKFDEDLRPLSRIIEMLPYGKRVVTLPYTLKKFGYDLAPYIHLGGYAQAARGGYSSFNFGHIPYKPQYAHHDLTNINWEIYRGYVLSEDARKFYDYVIVMTGPYYKGSPFPPLSAEELQPVRVFAERDLELWKIPH